MEYMERKTTAIKSTMREKCQNTELIPVRIFLY